MKIILINNKRFPFNKIQRNSILEKKRKKIRKRFIIENNGLNNIILNTMFKNVFNLFRFIIKNFVIKSRERQKIGRSDITKQIKRLMK